jgi:hypothetical protein
MSVHSRSDGKVGSENTDILFLLRIDLFALFQLIIFLSFAKLTSHAGSVIITVHQDYRNGVLISFFLTIILLISLFHALAIIYYD